MSFCPLVKGEEALIVTDFRDTSATEVRALYVNCSAYLCTFLQQSLHVHYLHLLKWAVFRLLCNCCYYVIAMIQLSTMATPQLRGVCENLAILTKDDKCAVSVVFMFVVLAVLHIFVVLLYSS